MKKLALAAFIAALVPALAAAKGTAIPMSDFTKGGSVANAFMMLRPRRTGSQKT